VLTQTEIQQFIRNGYVSIRGAVARDVVGACEDLVWDELGGRGIRRDEPSTWSGPVVRLPCPEGGPFVAAGTATALWEAYDQLLGEGTWWRREGVGGSIPVRFPSEADPGDAGWHVDASFPGPDGRYRLNVGSQMRGLLSIFLFTDVDLESAPTRLLKGSHLDLTRVLAPAGGEGLAFEEVMPKVPAAVLQREVAFATGDAGDVYVCHPFLVHAATWPHRGKRPRIIAQPGVATHRPFALDADAAESDLCPVEAAILRGLRA
jgi:hypothetical protein